MATNTYYQDELRYLRDVGPEFARANPEIARFLADRGSDPDVERLLEGVAFLCGRIRQKLDDELPEFTAGVLSMLWPHYLRPVPSMTILELLPDLQGMRAPLTVEPGAEFASIPIDGTRCKFRSCWPVRLRPWSLSEARFEALPAKPVRLVLRFRAAGKAQLSDLDLSTVRLHLAGDAAMAFSLYLLLSAHVANVLVCDGPARAHRPETTLDANCLRPAGLARYEAVIPYPPHSFAGYRLLQEYFAFKDRFLFVDLVGLDQAVAQLGLEQSVDVEITFNRRPESIPIVTAEHVRLHCVPAINLFSHPADPIRVSHERTQYLVQPSRTGLSDPRHAEVFSVDQVHGVSAGAQFESRECPPFYSFQHTVDPRSAGSQGVYFQTQTVPNVTGGDARMGTDTYLSFVSPIGADQPPREETLSIELTCTNRHLPAEIRAGDLRERADRSPAASFRNLTRPTATIRPPLGKGLHWRLISHMSLNYVPLTSAERLRELLRVYDFQAEHDAQLALAHERMLQGVVRLGTQFKERMVRGAPIRGQQVSLELNEEHFAGEGDAYLFASILDRFMALYVTVNAFSQLTVRFARNGQMYAFPPRWGDKPAPADREGGE